MGTQLYFFWSSISMILFYIFYLVMLRRETFFLLNRIYLLSALCLSMVLPMLDLSFLIALQKELMASTLSVIGGGKLGILSGREFNWLPIIYWTGVLFNTILLIFKLFGVRKQMKLTEKGSAFSFWRTKVIDQELADFVAIDAHENVHVKQFHTLDILLSEVVGVFFWFNLVIYGYRNSLKFIHEYLADDHAANFAESKKQYALVLFLKNFKAEPALLNTFYNASLLEARIKMLQLKKSNTYHLWKYLLYIPLIVLMTLTCSFSALNFNRDVINKIDQAAIFPGGPEVFSQYLIKNTRQMSVKNGTVNVSFIVESNGKVSNEKVEKGLDDSSNKEALRVIRLSPKWKPASQNGIPVRSAYQISINYKPNSQTIK